MRQSAIFTVEKVKQEIDSKRTHTFEEALELAGFGRAQLILLFLSGCTMMASIIESMGISIILPASDCDLLMDPGEKGMIGGAIFLGVMASSYFWGYQADTRGRKIVLQYALFVVSICSVASSFTNDFTSMMCLRLLTGVFLSAPTSTVYAYFGEFCPPKRRVQMLSYASIMGSVGIIFIAGIGWWLLSYNWSFVIFGLVFKPWRLLFIVYTIPGLLTAVAFLFCPESPKFLLSRSRSQEALDVLRWIHKVNKGSNSTEDFPVTSLASLDDSAQVHYKPGLIGVLKSMKDQTIPLLKCPSVLYFSICCLEALGAFSIYGGLALWFPQIMNKVVSDSATQPICSILQVSNSNASSTEHTAAPQCIEHVQQETFLFTAMLGLFAACVSFFMSLMLGRFQTKSMLIVNMAIAGVAGIVLQFVSNSFAVALLFCVEILFAGIGVLLVNGLAVSLFPTHVTGMAVALINVVGRFSCFAASAVIGLMIRQDCPLTFYLHSGLLLVCSAASLLLP
ncbi:synaptic vesicle glycoprotein 2B-like [Uranotaenia lowii]|uniref:synaptic vesicle glycoprotein 2B-like n=1 Tax=Uranotaenia lowii TaxID=190385 RepID=UPI00247992E9|nr:synaptic vesicle glycoprotein 2B-like [Uranotaenia lowii]